MSDFEKLIKAITNIEEVIQQGAQNGLKQAGIRVMGTAKAKLGTYQKVWKRVFQKIWKFTAKRYSR